MKAFALAAGLVGWSFVTPRLPIRWQVPVQVGASGLLVQLSRAPLGLCPPRLWSGLRLGLSTAAAASTVVAAVAAVPAVRLAMVTRQVPGSAAGWLVLHIPLGTVWAEEAAFRGALATVAAQGLGRTPGRLLQAAAFGLFHITDARRAGEPVVPTVLATSAAGWLLGWLAERSGSLAAPILVHLATNEAGAVAALAVRRRGALKDLEPICAFP